VLGEGKVCHTGTRSCFTQELPLGGALGNAVFGQENVGQAGVGQEGAER
jgi:hypothetical protein